MSSIAVAERFTTQDVCRMLPWSDVTVMANHSSLAALLAGFSLTAFAVLMSRDHVSEPRRNLVHRLALILLLLAVISGALASYLFSALSGDQCLNAVEEFNAPSGLLGACGLLLVGGLAVLPLGARGFPLRIFRAPGFRCRPLRLDLRPDRA